MEIVSRNHGMMKDRGLDRLRKSAVFQSIRNSFNLDEDDAFALTIMRKLSDILPQDNCKIEPGNAEKIIRERFGLGSGIEDIMTAISSWAGHGMVYEHISIPSWIQNVLPDDPMPSCLAVKDFSLSETAGYLEMDSRIVSVIRHAISAKPR